MLFKLRKICPPYLETPERSRTNPFNTMDDEDYEEDHELFAFLQRIVDGVMCNPFNPVVSSRQNRIYSKLFGSDQDLRMGLKAVISEIWSIKFNLDRGPVVLPKCVTRLTALTALTIENTHLKSVPENLCRLTTLRVLNLFNNMLKELPKTFGRLRLLEELDLSGNYFGEVPSCLRHFTALRILKMSETGVEFIPPFLCRMATLTNLDFKLCELISLPPRLDKLINLVKLDVGFNCLTHVPSSLGQLTKLVFLGFMANEIKELPDFIGDLPDLVWLSVEDNELTELPASLCLRADALVMDGLSYVRGEAILRVISKVERKAPVFQPATLLNQCLAYVRKFVE